jgi:tRNA threonylcarbamoyladenosine biosynthesis protein TsaE
MAKNSKSNTRDLNISKTDSKNNIFISKSDQETRLLGLKFASLLKKGDIVFFRGDLGSGKTTFIQGIVKYFGIKKYARSSSFIIANEYEGNSCKIIHLDLYRLLSSDIFDIGIDEYLCSENIALIEWADRLENLRKNPNWTVEMLYIDENTREIKIGKQ